MSCAKGGLNTKLHLAVDETGMPIQALITKGTEEDCKQAALLIEAMERTR